MAIRTISNTGGNWSSASAWVEGIVPTNVDDVVCTTTSGNITTTAGATCNSINFTNYNGTITFTSSLTVVGNITLATTMTFAGTAALIMSGTTRTITSNGKTLGVPLTFPSVTNTTTLADNLTTTASVSLPNITVTSTLNGNTFYLGSSFSHSNGHSMNGTTTLYFNGTGAYTGGSSGAIISNTKIIDTAGTLTITGNLAMSGTLTYISGTVNASGATLFLRGNSTLSLSGITFAAFNANSTMTITLNTDVTISGNASLGTTGNVTLNGNTLYVGGGLTQNNNTTTSGTTNIVMNGTGTLLCSTSGGSVRNNLTINTAGTITIGSRFIYNTGTFKHIAGTVVTTGSTFTISGNATMDTGSGIVFNLVTLSGSNPTITLNSTLSANSITCPNTGVIFAGTAGFNVNSFSQTATTAARTLTLLNSVNYIANTSLTLTGTSVYKVTVISNSGTVKANLKLTYGGTQNVRYTDATRIDSSGGETIYTNVARTLTDTINWGKSEGNMLLVL